MTTMSLIFHLEPALKDAQTLPAEKLPRLLGDLREVECTALARLSSPALAPATPDQLLNCKQAAQKLNCSQVYLYKNAALPFRRKLGRKLLFSANEIEEYLRSQK